MTRPRLSCVFVLVRVTERRPVPSALFLSPPALVARPSFRLPAAALRSVQASALVSVDTHTHTLNTTGDESV